MSAKLIPARATLIRTSPSAGSGIGASSTSREHPGAAPLGDRDGAHERGPATTRSRPTMSADRCRLDRLRRRQDPRGKRPRLLGGSAVHFSLAASFFADARVVGPRRRRLRRRRVRASCTARGRHRRHRARRGRQDLLLVGPLRARPEHRAHAGDRPQRVRGLPAQALGGPKAADILFLANIQPDLQREVREQCERARSSPWTR